MLRELVVARLEAGDHFLVELEASLSWQLEVPRFAVRRSVKILCLVQLHHVRIVSALGAGLVVNMSSFHRKDRIIEWAVSQVVFVKLLQSLWLHSILQQKWGSS